MTSYIVDEVTLELNNSAFKEKIRYELRKEFCEVYSKNEHFYQEHFARLNKIIEDKDTEIKKLLNIVEILSKKVNSN
uniref:Uncharacterized protein n=1 Tax=viral metagenome TaxID=1070528 RepID=A0A6C0B0P8_9ZZZZ